MTNTEMPIFTRTFDFLSWLMPATNHFGFREGEAPAEPLSTLARDARGRLSNQ